MTLDRQEVEINQALAARLPSQFSLGRVEAAIDELGAISDLLKTLKR